MGVLSDWTAIMNAGSGAAPPHFGDPHAEFEAARSEAILTPVTQFGLLRFHGSDAKTFLQGQLTCDLERVNPEQAQFGGYCTPKGRLLATFVLLSTPQGYLMHLPGDIAPEIANRLRKFVMRSRVTIEPESSMAMLGVAGPNATALLHQQLAASLPPGELMVAGAKNALALRLPGDHFLIMAAAKEMPAVWQALAQQATPAGAHSWDWVQIRAGIPWITAATQDRFLPQMVGLDAIGGVSFDKGCYPGQEIVARSRYLGEVKRKLRLGRARGPVHAAQTLFSGGQPAGTVLNAVPLPEGGSEFLAVVSGQVETQPAETADGESVSWLASAPS